MSSGELPIQPNIKDLLEIGAGDVVIPGQEEYISRLLGNPESPFLYGNPTAEEVREREQQFALKVTLAGIFMAKRNPGIVTLLPDVDQTFTEDEGRTIRPAFPYALNLLHQRLKNSLEVGLLTSIPQSRVNEMLPKYFKGVTALVNPEFAISSKSREATDPHVVQALADKDLSSVEKIVDPEIIKGTQEKTLSDIWFGSKLIILQQLAQQHSDRSFVFIDDLIWAGVIRDDHRQVLGVWVGPEMQNDRRRVGLEGLRIKKIS